MIYKLDVPTGEISLVSSEEARRALLASIWTKKVIDELFVSAKVLFTPTTYFCRFKNRLDELLEEQKSGVRI